ncbi:MAG: DUF3299 domain-containing protein [Magnetovibrio sp.]|nr:DUF3299 domain-containing protein [Magnetovibrio sp.]
MKALVRAFRLTAPLLAALLVSAPFLSGPVAAAEVAKALNWDNLVPEGPPLTHPFEHLSMDHKVELEMLYNIRRMTEKGVINEVSQSYEDGIELTDKLTRDGLDVEALLADYAWLDREVAKRNAAVVEDLDGKLVRIPGYALPLEFTDTAVKELLLVPYVGACIHVPPPPANQTVFVELNQSYKAKNLYEPVWITGRMKVKATNKSLSYVDGSAGVDAAYTLEGVRIEPYEQ